MGPRVLIVPSNRGACLTDFFRAWEGKGGWTDVVVVEDNPEKTFDLPPSYGHYSHKEIALDLGDKAWIISKKDSACRCYGFLVAWRMGASDVVTLDDDVRPEPGMAGTLLDAHRASATAHPRWVMSAGQRTRGVPYKNLGKLPWVVMNMGLWSGHADLDAVQTLSADPDSLGTFVPPDRSWVVPRGQYVNLCGMNLSACRAALPLLYFPLHGEGWPYRRMDDLWCGVVAKKVCDHLGWSLSVGPPHVRHERASDPFVNLVKEAPGIARHENFWEAVDGVRLHATDPAGCMAEVGHSLEGVPGAGPDGAYLNSLGRAITTWASLFTTPRKPAGGEAP